ncbi:Putative zn(2)Cys(6) fungal-type DNA-binding domain, fungal transcription factor [Colletotrichum destructivum]|uniref:Zn(2)Cys(6) fungal-type DNA-binding domain, fungal transcription factor n=1 Tax=Colletotrichum destructivum TaxID=34406 RepID=A0AAX4IHQ7_9PEZI|nr:Putative zn(2)Cys(6) fungal-type DNA-binding domain, fungal transcription factor [Colletotrichum destructivum]
MPKPLGRSNGGCWTCRIRHRKCDETSPLCKECTDRHIECHGYGTEPEWMKDPPKLRAELQRIKHAVKQNFRRTRKSQAASVRASRILEESSASGSIEATESAHEGSEFREAELIMYYLDYIFPLQYAYYADKPAQGGRGWLFWLLYKKGPLRHAAFTLSALHQHTISQSKTEEMESELIRHHTNAMQELRQVLSRCEMEGFDSHPEYRVEFLTCGTFLISFEVFQGGTSNWESHLKALVAVASQIDLQSIGAVTDPLISTRPDAGFQRIVNAATRFHMSQLLWFDLLSCISTGESPKLPYQRWLGHEDIDISCVMGCQNWAMLALGDVASLEAQGAEPNPRAMRRRVADIRKRIEDGIGYLGVQEKSTAAIASQSVTRVFATAILVQLRAILVNVGEPSEIIHEAVTEVIDALQKVPKGVPIRGMPWPICVAGAMADSEQQSFFENLIEEVLETSGAGFTNCDTVQRILKESWKDQNQFAVQGIPTWRQAMSRLGICALLV